MKRTITRTAITVTAALAALPLVGIGGGPAQAVANFGVKWVSVINAPDSCLADNPLPCTPGAGTGESNVIRVTQSLVDGYHRFTTLDTTSQLGDGHVWLGTELDAECRRGYKLFMAEVSDQDTISDGGWHDVHQVGVWYQPVTVPFARTMPAQRVAANMPISPAMRAALIAEGEAEIARRVADGQTPAEARSQPYSIMLPQSLTAGVVCRGNVGLHFKYYKSTSIVVPITVEYVPVDAPAPAGRTPQPGGLAVEADVTDVALTVLSDPQDSCTLHLSAAIHTNQPTTVEYRFVQPDGSVSGTYAIDVDQALVGFVSHEVGVPTRLDGPGGLAERPTPTTIGGVVAPGAGAGLYQGTYTIEVTSPGYDSAADGFSVAYCS